MIAFKAKLERLATGLSTDPSGLRALDADTQQRVFDFLIECSCLAQSEEAVRMGTLYLRQAPRNWVVERIKAVMTKPEFLEDEYAFRRLVTLCERLDPRWGASSLPAHELVRLAVATGQGSRDPDIKAFAIKQAARLSSERTPAIEFEPPAGVRAMLMEQGDESRLSA